MVLRKCEHCGSEYETEVGLKNWKKLFKAPTLQDWITLFIIAMVIVAAYAYSIETKMCRDTMSNIESICLQYSARLINNTYTTPFVDTISDRLEDGLIDINQDINNMTNNDPSLADLKDRVDNISNLSISIPNISGG